MSTVSWKGATADWSVAADWSPAGVPNGTGYDVVIAGGGYVVTIATGESFTADSVTMTASGTVQVGGTLTLGGTLGTFTLNSGYLQLGGTGGTAGGAGLIAGGTVVLGGGTLYDLGAGTITSTVLGSSNGAIVIAGGQTLTLANGGTLGSGNGLDVQGGGTLVTGGTLAIGSFLGLDASLAWVNGGTVLDGTNVTDGYTTNTGAYVITNQASGAFDLTADGAAFVINGSATSTFSNACTLAKTGGIGTSTFAPKLTSTGKINVASGTLELDGLNTLGGVIAGAGTLSTVGNTSISSGTSVTVAGLAVNGGTLSFAGNLSYGGTLSGSGRVALGTGQTLTESGTVAPNGLDFIGPGTLATTGMVAGGVLYLDGGASWTNGGTVVQLGNVYLGSNSASGNAFAITNQAGGAIDLGADGNWLNLSNSATVTLTNAGTFAKTGGTGVSAIGTAVKNTGTISVASGILALDAGGSLGGKISGPGTLELGGGTFTLAGTGQAISAPFLVAGGTVSIASGQTLTLSGSDTFAQANVNGPGTLATTGTTTINASLDLDGSLTWVNSGTVLTGGNYIYLNYPSSTGTVTVQNSAAGVFALTADGAYVINYGGTNSFVNAGTLAKTAGTGTSNIATAVTSTGTINVATGTLEFDGGGTFSGVFNGAGVVSFYGSSSTIAAGASLGAIGGVRSSYGTLAFAASKTLSNFMQTAGTVLLASGSTLTLSGADTLSGAINGPGTLATTGTTTLAGSLNLDGSLAWINSGTVITAGNYMDLDYPSTTGTVIVQNNAGAAFDLTADGAVFYSAGGTNSFVNAGTLAKTGGSGISSIATPVTDTGTISVASGTLEFDGGGTFSGPISGAGVVSFFEGSSTIAAGASLSAIGGVRLSYGTLAFAASQSLSNLVQTDGIAAIATGQALTLSGTDTLNGGSINGPGTLATTGTITTNNENFDGSLIWINSGTVLNTGWLQLCYPSFTGSISIQNNANAAFDLTADGVGIYNYNTVANTFTNAGIFAKTGGTGTSSFNLAVTNTGTITATTGTLELDAGGTVNGTIGATGTAVVQLGNGTAFQTTGTATIVDAGATANGMRIVNGATWTDTGVINDAGRLQIGNNSGTSTLAIAAGATFNLTTNDASLVYGGGSAMTNAGIIAKTGGTGTSTINFVFTNTGTVDVASGTLKLQGGAAGTGRLQIEAGKTLELASGPVAAANTIVFNGTGATLKIDTNSAPAKPIIGLGIGSRIDLAAAASASAVISGNTLTVTPTGGTALTFVSTTSLAGLHAAVASDGGTGSVITFDRLAAASTHTPEPVAFGAHHVGDVAKQTLTETNTAAADGYSENLDASLSTTATGFTATGSFTGLAAGASNSTSLAITLATATDGNKAGTAALALLSDGGGVDGSGQTALPTQTVNVTGAVYAYAAPKLSATSVNLGAVRVGGAALTGGVTLADGTTVDPYQESLVYALAAAPAGLSVTNGAGTITSGKTAAVGFSLATTAAGNFTGTALATTLTSSGVGTSGLANTALTGKTVTVNGQVYATAVAQFSAATVNFGVVHVGDTVTAATLSLSNAAVGTLTDVLTGGTSTVTGTYTGAVTLALGTGLAAGASTQASFGLVTTASGLQSGTATFGFTSHDAVLADIAANSPTITVAGTVDNYAIAQLEAISGGTLTGSGSNYVINLGTLVQNAAAPTLKLGVKNAATGLADLLAGAFTLGTTTGFTNTGFTAFSGLGAGQDEELQGVTLSTANTGTFSETITLAATGSNANYSGTLTPQTLTITGVVASTVGQTYTLAVAPVTIAAGAGNDTFIATNGALNSRENLNGGAGSNTLMLSGGGVFDLGAPKTLLNIQVVQATEGQAASGGLPDTRQSVFLRDATTFTVNVAAGTPASGNTSPETITIYGGADASTINLATGSDVVVLGGASEKVNTTGGTALVQALIGYAPALIQGTGHTTLEFTTGGTATMNAATGTGATAASPFTVQIDAASVLTLSKIAFVQAVGQVSGNTITAQAKSQTIGGLAGSDTLVGYAGFGDTFLGTSAGLNNDIIKTFGGTGVLADTIDVTDLTFASAVATYTAGTGQGVLSVTDGTHTTSLTLVGTFSPSHFHTASDGHTGTLITYS